jgi:ubiquinone/menaquinone biosynthesis C-methylase UbiE
VNEIERTAGVTESYDALAPVWAATTDDNLWNEALDRRPILSLLEEPIDALRVLDVGTAAGALAERLLDRGAEVTGVDISPEMIEVARARCGGRGRFLAADLSQTLPFDDDSFDGVVASLVMHYVEDWTAVLDELSRVLRPGGWLIVSTDHPHSPFARASTTRYLNTELVTDVWTKADVTVSMTFWRRSWSAILNAFAGSGFVLERVVEPGITSEDRHQYPDDASLVPDDPMRIVIRWKNRYDVVRTP